MRKVIRPQKLLFILLLLIEVAALNSAVIFRLSYYLLVIPLIVIPLLAYLLTRSSRQLGLVFMVSVIALVTSLPNSWLWGWWERRHLRSSFELESAAATVLNQSIIDEMTGAVEKEKLKELATAFKAGLRTDQAIAQLEIPRIGLNVIVVEGTGDSSLRKGPGHLEETPLPGMQGNFAVAGDRVLYGAPFLNLDEMEAGDEIILKTPYGRFVYAVSSKSIVIPEDVSVIKSNGTEMITLSTCDPPWDTSRRLVVQGTVTEVSLL